ncbi:MAG TPA: hypothetical protein VER33_00400 [Polyangiaceae bacterium]|nr:hypothetical protein [Polyangiaceae bacterium]
MARHPNNAEAARSDRPDPIHELEELGDEAIIAQEQLAHAPQKRAYVSEEARSVVISDPPPVSSRPLQRYRIDRGEPTMVLSGRPDLEEARRKILARKSGQPRVKDWKPYVGGALALLTLVVGGWLVFSLSRAPQSGEGTLVNRAASRALPLSKQVGAARLQAPREAAEEAPAPQVKLEELPIEKPRRRRRD